MSIELNTQRLQSAVDLQEQTKTAAVVLQDNHAANKIINNAPSEEADMISKTARALQTLFSRISNTPDVDPSRVAMAKERLARGEIDLVSNNPYNVEKSARQIADKMIQFERALIKER